MGNRLLEDLFLHSYSMAKRVAQVRCTAAIRLLRTEGLDREDLEQEVLMGVWTAVSRFDPLKASIRTYLETVIGRNVASTLRKARSKKRTSRKTSQSDSIQVFLRIDLRIDIDRVLSELSARDRQVAQLLPEYRPTDVARILRLSRPVVYRSIDRIRSALARAGFAECI
jgi:RNA polymerase sigma factor (sigma-70 family)